MLRFIKTLIKHCKIETWTPIYGGDSPLIWHMFGEVPFLVEDYRIFVLCNKRIYSFPRSQWKCDIATQFCKDEGYQTVLREPLKKYKYRGRLYTKFVTYILQRRLNRMAGFKEMKSLQKAMQKEREKAHQQAFEVTKKARQKDIEKDAEKRMKKHNGKV